MIKYHPSSSSSKPLAHVLTIQGHPEYTPEIVAHMVNTRSDSGLFDRPTTSEARRRLGGKDGSGAEGFGKVGWGVWRVLLQELPGETRVGEDLLTKSDGRDIDGDVLMNGQGRRGVDTYLADQGRYRDIDMVLDKRGPWTHEQFVGGEQVRGFLAAGLTVHRRRRYYVSRSEYW